MEINKSLKIKYRLYIWIIKKLYYKIKIQN